LSDVEARRRTGRGEEMHALCRELFPICRSLTGPGFRESMAILQREFPALQMRAVPSGTQVFDWVVPNEWSIRDAWIETPSGERICDLRTNNLHVVGYSVPVDAELSLEDLQSHLYSLPDQPDAIPYITSYYSPRWGFCLTQRQRDQLRPGRYRVHIDSTLAPGVLNYAHALIPGESREEVFLSSYLCHPSMANNELSGPVVATWLGKWLQSLPRRRYTYRIFIGPETIGSIAYLARHLDELKERVVAGYVLTCMGDERAYSYVPSRHGDSLPDRAAKHVLGHLAPDYLRYSFLDRGSDERQYCSPGVDLPVASVMRSKYGVYPEYHTSLDDLSLVTPAGLAGGFEAVQRCIECIEADEVLRTSVLCEPQLGKRGLYPTLSTKTTGQEVKAMMDLLAYCDGEHSLLEIAARIGVPLWTLTPSIERLKQHGLLVPSKQDALETA
jgi:aminopeptidase-like protein